MTHKRIFSFGLAAVMAASMLAGCGGTSSSSSTAGASEAGSASAAASTGSGEEVSLRFSWWGDDERHNATLEVIEMYEALHPNVTISGEYGSFDGFQDKLATQVSGNTQPDLMSFNAGWMGEYAQKEGLLVDFYEMEEQGLIDLSHLDMDFVEDYGLFDGRLIGLPSGINARITVINPDVFEMAGIDSSLDQEWTWETLIEEGKKVHEADPDSYFMSISTPATLAEFVFTTYMKQLTGNNLVNDDGTLGFTQEQCVDALDMISRLYSEGVVQPLAETAIFGDSMTANPKWAEGKIAAIFEWTSGLADSVTNLDGKAQLFVTPIIEGAEQSGIEIKPTQLYGVSASSASVEETVKFLDYFLNDEEAALVLRDVRSVPPSTIAQDACTEAGLIDQKCVDGIDMAYAHPSTPRNTLSQNSEVIAAVETAVEAAAYGSDTSENIAANLIAQIEMVLVDLV